MYSQFRVFRRRMKKNVHIYTAKFCFKLWILFTKPRTGVNEWISEHNNLSASVI